jgi:hypothetical protein
LRSTINASPAGGDPVPVGVGVRSGELEA